MHSASSFSLPTLLFGSGLWLVSALSAQTVEPAVEGPKIMAEAFAKLSGALGEAIAQGGPASALSVCSEKAPQIAQEVAAAHGVTIRRATAKPRNAKNAADDEETAVLEAFMVALAKNETPKPQTKTNADGSRSFLAPIVLGNPLCLQCHGQPNQDIAPETLAAIQKLYPDDKATGFRLGDLRGLWHIVFPPALDARVTEPEVIPIQVRENLHIVYQVTEDALYEDVNKGLFYARKLLNTYERQGIAPEQVHLHLVYHGTGIAAVVQDEARRRLGAETVNPNSEILAELIQRGVQVELCENTMQQKGIKPTELMPGVKLVVGAFPRLIDLQLQGCAYIKFE